MQEDQRLTQIQEDVQAIMGHSYVNLMFMTPGYTPPPITPEQWAKLADYMNTFQTTEWPKGELKMLMVATKPYREVQIGGVKEAREAIVAKYDALKNNP